MHSFPNLLKQLHKIEFDYEDGKGIDFEPYENFLSEKETNKWLKAWTGNSEVKGDSLLVFGQDGTGGYAAFWLINKEQDILKQPIVFLGSEGEIGVVANNFDDYLWLLAQKHGPFEAIYYPENSKKVNQAFLDFAKKCSKSEYREVLEIIKDAKNTHPDFETWIESLIR
ncbi:hypothetical protein F909_00418 [Acinetobacter sp. ANC 3929]|uniref:SMI1/KNR4 family protein n=1 Tax=unclassified Acinetobacter TaxID=196816 RepID=UPI0002CE93CC|nr:MULTISPECIES: SMI1/KNR4 family protein [unclassified Acinetobacter]ENW83752.1 hypothetical protein F909_00418 [Acinetobacter sp. ANC 3929]MCH7353368.1 SMI1/KNR4 family protein [Acinetobacter sp. NIPH 2023]MCH7357024.1 SMI1/KNR4 family protein [Acinetobacter sp. NIPH 1958]MCH7360750.1 SMI1/KNR4 family protein [Acinetobacter sp. NIPH 2024]